MKSEPLFTARLHARRICTDCGEPKDQRYSGFRFFTKRGHHICDKCKDRRG